MFPKDDDKLQIKLSGEYDSQPVSYVLLGTESKELIDLNELDRIARREFAEANGETETDVFDGSSVYMIGEQTLTESIRLNRLTRVTGTLIRLKPQIKISYVSPFEHLNGNIVNRIIKNDAYKLICLNALQLFDPEIEDIMIFRSDVSNRPVEYLKHKRLGNMPLSTYGDGIKKVLVLANAIIGATDGILLIDEIETAIHRILFCEHRTPLFLIRLLSVYSIIFLRKGKYLSQKFPKKLRKNTDVWQCNFRNECSIL